MNEMNTNERACAKEIVKKLYHYPHLNTDKMKPIEEIISTRFDGYVTPAAYKRCKDERDGLKSMATGVNERLQKALREFDEQGDAGALTVAIKRELEITSRWGCHP